MGGTVMLPWLALWVANWRLLTALAAIPMILACLAHWLLPESARWLLSQGIELITFVMQSLLNNILPNVSVALFPSRNPSVICPGRVDETIEILRNIAHLNGKVIPNEVLEDLRVSMKRFECSVLTAIFGNRVSFLLGTLVYFLLFWRFSIRFDVA